MMMFLPQHQQQRRRLKIEQQCRSLPQKLAGAWFVTTAILFLILLQTKRSYGQVTSNCASSINDIELAEQQITDYSTVRTYILCAGTTYTVARTDYFNSIVFETGSYMIHLRPNLHIQCGDNGLRSNSCIVSGGTIQVDGTSFFTANSTGTVLSNVVLTGLTFSNVEKHHVWIDRPGTVLFKDCAFQDNTDAVLPLLLDYFDPSTSGTTELIVTIEQSEFLNSVYYGIPSVPSLIVSNSKQNRLVITDSNFTRNDMIFNNTNFERASFLIESSGPVELQRNCFQHNLLGVAPVAVYGSTIVATDNFLYNSTGAICQLSAYFTSASYATFTPICASSDSPRCVAIAVGSSPINTTTSTPTTAPVGTIPTLTPTIAPSFFSPVFSPPTTTNDTAPTTPVVVPSSPTTTSTNNTAPSPVVAPTGMVFWSTPPTTVDDNTTLGNGTQPEIQFNTTSAASSWSSFSSNNNYRMILQCGRSLIVAMLAMAAFV